MTQLSYHISYGGIEAIQAQVMARHTSSMRESIFEGDVGGGPLVLQNEVFANEGGKRSLPCEGIAGVGGVIDKVRDGCRGKGLGGGARIE